MKTIVDDFENELFLRTKNAEIFCDYVKNNYDITVPAISGKLYHTLRVADACTSLAQKLGLNQELAYNIGLLHDFSRFYQWAKFGSFADHKTVDHADEAAKLLFDENQISMFDINENDRETIRLAVKNHNKKEIDLEEIKNVDIGNFDKILEFCKLIRDCDKFDIAYRFYKGDLNIDFGRPGVSAKVVESYQKNEMVDKRDVKTSADDILTLIGYLFDVNYKEIYDYINMDLFWNGVDEFYCKKLNKEDNDIVQQQIETMKQFISKRTAKNEKYNI